jgi:predicted secreted protein
MKRTIFSCAIVFLCALSFVMCSNNSKPTSNTPEQQQQGLAGPLPGGQPRPNMDTRKTTTTEMQKANAKKSLKGNVLDGCQERITIKQGETFTLLLPAVAGTGYVWTLPTAPTLLTQKKTAEYEYQEEPSTDPNIVGKAQKQILEFTGTKAGTETINIVYIRLFDKTKVENKCTISVTVQ